MRREHTLLLGGWLSAAIAALHVIIVFVGPSAYRYFGAGEEMARQAAAGSLVPAALTLVIAAVFVVFALYAFSGAGLLRRLPLLRTGLIAIAAIYILRGLLLLPQLAQSSQGPGTVLPRDLTFSGVSLAIGIVYLVGTVLLWPARRSTRSTG